MLETNPIEIKKRVDAANAKLPRIIAKVASLPEAERKLIGHLPTSVKRTGDVSIVENLYERLGLDGSTPIAKPAPAPSLGAKALEAVTNPKTAAPAVAGVRSAMSEQAKLDARLADARLIRSSRARLAALKDIKNDVVMSQNDEHRAKCETARDEILSAMRARMNGKKA